MLFGTMNVLHNELSIGGLAVSDLVKRYGSPLYVYDKTHIKDMIDTYQHNFSSELFNARVAYASKAFLTKSMVRLLQEKSMSIDLVSLGEMYTAKTAGFDMSKAIIHGNNKSEEELRKCFEYNVGLIVVDNIYELKQIIMLSNELKQNMKTLLRVNPGVEAHTHEYIVTAKLTSKFGESIYDDEAVKTILGLYANSTYLSLEGFHCHIGSQIFDGDSFVKTIDVMSDFITKVERTYNVQINTLNLGGGFGVYYVEGDTAIDVEDICKKMIQAIEVKVKNGELHLKELIIEPGRSIVSNAGSTLYRVGNKKETFGGKNYLFIDGGMTDNIRPALYQAKYSCDIATNMNGKKTGKWTVAGKLCESGDLIINDTPLQPFNHNDILVVYTTGAYNYSMVSNYNKMLKPAVVFVENGQAELVVRRETLEDLIKNDL